MDGRGFIGYANLPDYIGAIIGARHATLAELQTLYSVEDAWLIMEVLTVEAHNKRAAQPKGG